MVKLFSFLLTALVNLIYLGYDWNYTNYRFQGKQYIVLYRWDQIDSKMIPLEFISLVAWYCTVCLILYENPEVSQGMRMRALGVSA